MTNTEEEKDYIGICIEFGTDLNVIESTFVSTYWGVGVNDGLRAALEKNGVTYKDVLEVIKSALGDKNLSKVAHDVADYYVREINSKPFVHFDLGDTKIIDGKVSVPIVQLQYGLLREGKWGLNITDEEYGQIIKETIGDEKFNEMHKILTEKIFSKIPGRAHS